jgi:single-strand DNA-binding protein
MQVMTVIGYLGRDAETKDVNGKTVTNFSVCHTEKWKDQQGQTQERAMWDQPGVAQYLKKGTQVYLTGPLYPTTYTDKNGHEQIDLRLTVRQVQLLSAAKSGDQGQTGGQPESSEGTTSGGDPLPF